MTQQSLIARLKAVEEALENTLEYGISLQEFESDPLVLGNIRRDVTRAEAALSDLRELINEAEGQPEVGVIDIYLMDEMPPRRKTVPTYTALGEKP